jgi:hypothetical protein
MESSRKFPAVRVSRRNSNVKTIGKVGNGALVDGKQTHQYRTLTEVEENRNSA